MPPEKIRIGNRTIEMDNLDKVIFPDIEFTQGDLLDYYRKISDPILLHLNDRPLTLQRFPAGIGEEGFYQKKASDYFPDWIQKTSIEVKGESKKQYQVVCNDIATLAYLVDQGCITFHIWQSMKDKLHYPDRMIFDLDPPDDDFELVRQGALELKELLDKIELKPFVMTTGSRGLHVVTPLDRNQKFDTVRGFAKKITDHLSVKNPNSFTTKLRKKERGRRLFLDYLRNSYGQNSVAPYSVRARSRAPVATPLDWDELKKGDLHSQMYTVKNILRRMGQKEDPWREIKKHAGSLESAQNKFEEI